MLGWMEAEPHTSNMEFRAKLVELLPLSFERPFGTHYRITCGNCGQKFEVDAFEMNGAELIGQSLDCPHCHMSNAVERK